jgi:hypothetical protein
VENPKRTNRYAAEVPPQPKSAEDVDAEEDRGFMAPGEQEEPEALCSALGGSRRPWWRSELRVKRELMHGESSGLKREGVPSIGTSFL